MRAGGRLQSNHRRTPRPKPHLSMSVFLKACVTQITPASDDGVNHRVMEVRMKTIPVAGSLAEARTTGAMRYIGKAVLENSIRGDTARP